MNDQKLERKHDQKHEEQKLDPKLDALLTVAYDFYERKDKIQYDQRSLDRFVQLTPRRRKFLPPEAATGQYTLYLDCSGFCFDVYYQAFGFELPSDLTWHMVKLLKPRVYYYERTNYKETQEEKEKITAEIKSCLKPGDLITLRHQGNSGHIMLYIGNGRYMNCRPEFAEIDDSYDYEEMKNHYRECGGIYIDSLDNLFYPKEDGSFDRYYLFSPKESCITISRPLYIVGEPTEETLVRMGKYKGLWTSVESSCCGGRSAAAGDRVEYKVTVRNLTDETKEVAVCFKAPEGSRLVERRPAGDVAAADVSGCAAGESSRFGDVSGCTAGAAATEIKAKLAAKEEREFSFAVEVLENEAERFYLDGPQVSVNDLPIYTQRVLLGKAVEAEKVKQLICDVKEETAEGADAAQAAAIAYGKQGIDMEAGRASYMFSHFYLHDTTKLDVLSRRPQNPYKDMAVYSLFGGTGVVTPEMGSSTGIRTTCIKTSDLMAGDVIICSDDTFGEKSYSAFFTGESLIGAFDAAEAAGAGKTRTIEGEEVDRFVDSLFGRFCFIVLRPYLAG